MPLVLLLAFALNHSSLAKDQECLYGICGTLNDHKVPGTCLVIRERLNAHGMAKIWGDPGTLSLTCGPTIYPADETKTQQLVDFWNAQGG